MNERVWPPADVKLNDLGHGVQWSKSVDKEGNWIGILEWHKCRDDDPEHLTAGGVYFRNAPEWIKGARWDLVQEDPLTLSPSVLCKRCGLHGFIQEGRWVPA